MKDEISSAKISKAIELTQTQKHKQKENEITADETKSTAQSQKGRNIQFLIYCYMALCWGISRSLSPSLYIEFEEQVNANKSEIALCFVTRSTCAVISSITSGIILDKYSESHHYLIFLSILYIIATSYLPFVKNIYILHVILGVHGYIWSAMTTLLLVYILRLFGEQGNGSHKMYIATCVYSISKSIFPFFIQMSIQNTNKYIYPVYITNGMFLLLIFGLLYFKTPKHDKLRTIKAALEVNKNKEIANIELLEEMAKIAKADNLNKCYEINLMVFLNIVSVCYSGFGEFYLTFAALYVTNYLNKDDKYGRYLISIFFIGELSFRLLSSLAGVVKNISPPKSLTISFILLFIFNLIFLFIDNNIIWLFILWFFGGFLAAGVWVELYAWTELIKPVSGQLSLIYTLTNAFGEIIAVLGFGVLIETYSVQILKYCAFSFVLMALVSIITCDIIFYCYGKHRKTIESIAQQSVNNLLLDYTGCKSNDSINTLIQSKEL
eukprot:224859_1